MENNQLQQDVKENYSEMITTSDQSELETELRRGPWTVEEDMILINYISLHGEGRWNSLARSAGLKRTGKSCRLRWLNYLRPDVRRGNITLEEQLLILELHYRWGNRWSKIAQHLPGRTDNEIKNYWRTRVQKHAKQLKCHVDSKQFKDTMRYLWMPRLVEKIRRAKSDGANTLHVGPPNPLRTTVVVNSGYSSENNSSSDSFGTPGSDMMTECFNGSNGAHRNQMYVVEGINGGDQQLKGHHQPSSLIGPAMGGGYHDNSQANNNGFEFMDQYQYSQWMIMDGGDHPNHLDVVSDDGDLWNNAAAAAAAEDEHDDIMWLLNQC